MNKKGFKLFYRHTEKVSMPPCYGCELEDSTACDTECVKGKQDLNHNREEHRKEWEANNGAKEILSSINSVCAFDYEVGKEYVQLAKFYGPFSLFDTLDHATFFRWTLERKAWLKGKLFVYDCTYEASDEQFLWYWSNNHQFEIAQSLVLCPEGTILARRFKILFESFSKVVPL